MVDFEAIMAAIQANTKEQRHARANLAGEQQQSTDALAELNIKQEV